MRRAAAIALFALLALGSARAQSVDDDDARAALHASFRGDAKAVLSVARERHWFERAVAKDSPRRLAENIAALGAATSRPPFTRRETKNVLEDFRTDGETEAFLQLVRETEPRERFRTARANRRYEDRRRALNSATNAVFGVLQLQFFGLVQPPLDGIEWLVSGYRYLNPEERRELQAAREVQVLPAETPKPSAARGIVRDWTELRANTAGLQARKNAELCEREGRLDAAAWWWERERALRGADAPFREDHVDAIAAIEKRDDRRRRAVVAGETDEPVDDADYRALVRAEILRPADRETVEIAARFAVGRWDTPMQGDLRLAEILQSRESGDAAYARAQMEELAATDTPAGARMAAYLAREDFTPAVAFDAAHDAIRGRKTAFVVSGADPQVARRSLSAEDARRIQAAWIGRARQLFVFDTIARTIAFPLLPGDLFPRDELFDAWRSAPEDFRATDRGREEARRVAKAYASVRRYEDSARLYDAAGDAEKSASMRQKAARAVERAARKEKSAAARADEYRQLLNAYPDYRKRARAEKALADAEFEANVLARIERRDLKAYPELRGAEALGMDAVIVEKVMTREGVALLRNDRVAYVERSTKSRIEIDLPEGAVDRTLEMLLPRRRVQAVVRELNAPRELKRVPLAVQGGALPDFAMSPGLVPLEPDAELRRLYE